MNVKRKQKILKIKSLKRQRNLTSYILNILETLRQNAKCKSPGKIFKKIIWPLAILISVFYSSCALSDRFRLFTFSSFSESPRKQVAKIL